MKRNIGLLLVALLAALMLLVSGCGEKQETPDGAPDEPLMQEEDLTIEPQPDANFTLELPDGFLSLGADYEPNGETQDTTYDSDGMLPYDFARHYDADAQLVVGTDYYPETGSEVISYLRTDAARVAPAGDVGRDGIALDIDKNSAHHDNAHGKALLKLEFYSVYHIRRRKKRKTHKNEERTGLLGRSVPV